MICASQDTERLLLTAAHRAGMSGGDYIYFAVHYVPEPGFSEPWIQGNNLDQEEKKAYRSVLRVGKMKERRNKFNSIFKLFSTLLNFLHW